MATSSGGDPGGMAGPLLPPFMDPENVFGRLIVLKMTAKDNKPLPQEPFIIGESIELAIGGTVDFARSEAKGTYYSIFVRNPAHADKLIALEELTDGTAVSVDYHPKLNVTKCVISSNDLLMKNEDEIATKLSGQGVTKVQRITRKEKGSKVNTPALILTFNGTTFPKHVKVGVLRINTRPYYPNPLQCYGCYQYGHPSSRCPGPKRCYNCSDEHQVEECDVPAHCINCNGEHRPNNRKCPVYQTETKIVKIKVDHNLTYQEARKRVQSGNSYAAAAAQPRLEHIKVNALMEANKKKDEQIAKLIECNNLQSQEIKVLAKTVDHLKTHIAELSEKIKNYEQNGKQSSSTQNTHNQSSSSSRRNRSKRRNSKEKKQQNTVQNDRKSPPPKRATREEIDYEIDEIMDTDRFKDPAMYLSDSEEPGPNGSTSEHFRNGTQN